MGIRLTIVDDNPHLAWDGRTHPVNATFQRFAAGLLDLPGAPVASITSCVPLGAATAPPSTLALDPRILVVGTAPFDGIAGYLRHLPGLLRANRRPLGRAMADADLVLIKVPASNAGLAAALAVRAHVPRFVWVAGRATDVARGRYGGGTGIAAQMVGSGYDLAGRLASVGGHRLVVGEAAVDGDGIVASLVEPGELRDPDSRTWPPSADAPARLVWAGRLVEGKGLESLLTALPSRPPVTLELVGDGPARGPLEEIVLRRGIGAQVRWAGHIADRLAYLDRLAAADAFVFPSPAEGFPKVVLDALAVGLPVLATRVGALASLADAGLVEPIERPDPGAIEAAWLNLQETDPDAVADRRRRGVAFAAGHTRSAEVARLVARWRGWWPALPWDR